MRNLFFILFLISSLSALEKISLQLQWLDQFQFAGYYVAKEKGFYEDVGLDVELKKYNSVAPVSEVINKKATYGIGRSTLLIDKSKGANIKLLAAIFQSSPSVFIATKESNINSVKDFSGKSMMITDDASSSVPLLAIAKREGLDIQDVDYIKHSFNIDDLINKKTDLYSAYISNEPYLLQKKGIEINIFNPSDLGFSFYDDIIFTSSFEIQNHKQRAINFTNASIKGWKYAFSHIEEIVDLIYVKYNSQNKSKDALRYEAHELKKLAYLGTEQIGELDLNHVQRIYDVYNVFGYIEDKIDLKKFIVERTNGTGVYFTVEEQNYLINNKTIKFTGDPNWLPFEAFDENGEYIGIVADHLKLVEKKANITFKKIVSKDWTNAINMAINGDVDVISGDAADVILNKKFMPIEAYIKNPIVIIQKGKHTFVNNLEELKDKRIAIIKDYGYTADIYKAHPNIKFIEVENIQDALLGLEIGKHDVALASLSASSYFISQMGLNDIYVVGKTSVIMNVTLFVNKTKPLLHSIINKTMKSITPSKHQKILHNWTHGKTHEIINYDLLIKGTLVFMLFLLLFIYRHYILSKSNKKLAKLTQEVPGVIYQYRLYPDGHACFPYASNGIENIYEVKPEDVIKDAQPVFDILHPDDLEMIASTIHTSAETMNNWNIQYRVNLPKKGMRWLEGFSKPEKLEDGSTLWHGYIHDITDEKRQYDLYEQQVKENQILTETTKDGFWIVGEEGKLLDVNTAYCEMSGYSKEELLAMRIPELEAIESEEETRAHIEKIMHNGSDTFDTVHRKKNGETFDVNITATYINLDGIKLFTSIRDITESKEHSKQIEQLAYFDKLTGLANRTLLSDRIEHAIKHSNRNKRDFAICMVDLDGFKEVNDSFGHDAGDYILIEAAKRMQKEIREDDTVARLGGDEFVLILTDVENNDACALALQRVLDSLSKPYMNNNQQITSITASIGVSIYPNDKVHSDALLRHADIAMYKSKNSGKNKFTFFDITSENRVQETSKILNRLKNAINSGQFILYYQPKYEPASSEIAEVEALVRWNHPTMGMLSPAEFLPIIENDDELSLLLDKWVVNEAFNQLQLWLEQNIELKVCINISPKQFKGDLFQDWFCAFIASEQVPKDHLKFVEFEILETSVMDNITESNEFITKLQENGISLALDDFGTGYSSLTHLKELQVNTIKIDQLFVREMFENDASMTIVKAVIALSKAFNLSVTAEGAETMKHVDTLIEMGCDEIQGYAISHPLPVSDIVEFINSFKFKQNEKNT